MKSAGPIKKTDWKMYGCVQELGTDHLISWGNYDDAVSTMNNYAEHGHDVWIIGPDGDKETPS